MSVATVRKYFANVKFWFLSWKKNREYIMLEKIIRTIKSIKDLVAAIDIRDVSVDDRIALSDIVRETEEIEAAINSIKNAITLN